MTPQLSKRSRILAAILLSVVMTACQQADAKKVGDAIGKVQVAVSGLRNTVHTANTLTPQAITDEHAMVIYKICDKLDNAGIEADKATRSYSQLPAGTKPQLAALVNPILTAIDDSIANDLISIKDPVTRQNIQAALATISSGLVVIQSVVGG